jgi:hypothetical protein
MLEEVDDMGRYEAVVAPGMSVEELRHTLAIRARQHLEREIYVVVEVRERMFQGREAPDSAA